MHRLDGDRRGRLCRGRGGRRARALLDGFGSAEIVGTACSEHGEERGGELHRRQSSREPGVRDRRAAIEVRDARRALR
jgi:hypothetical protein